MTTLPQLIDGKPVAEALNLKLTALYDYARRGLIPCVRIGRHVRFRPEDIAEFIANGGKALSGGWKESE
jgi:excisionase family DNA binding protein